MLKFGLTGGIGSGKSVVCGMLRGMGAHIIDADVLAKDALSPGRPAFDETVRVFGPGILDGGGRIDRGALADVVFGDPAKRAALEGIIHPRVFEAEALAYEAIAKREPDALVFFDAPLLIESGAYRRFRHVVLVWCRPETQLARVMAKWGLNRVEALLRVQAQMPLEEKLGYAAHVIDNDGTLEQTQAQVRNLFKVLAGARLITPGSPQ